MKNIYLLPTDKPSRLIFNSFHKSFCYQKEIDGMYINDGKVSGADFWGLQKALNNGFKPQHIYITSDEEIKEDYVIAYGVVTKVMTIDEEILYFVNGTWVKRQNCKKIILTTDPELINDGVQAIEDEFLEWFVKNPSCEEIGVEQLPLFKNPVYKTVIPKEEPKQDSVYKCTCLRPQVNCFSGMCSYCNRQIVKNLTTEDLKPKIVGEYQQELFNYLHDLGVTALQSEMQEVERIVLSMQQENSNINALHFEIDALKREIKVFKHQQEQDKNKFSEEDMIEASKYGYNFHKTTQFPNIKFEDSCIRNFQQWLTIFKKK